jgi:hypothetical protein
MKRQPVNEQWHGRHAWLSVEYERTERYFRFLRLDAEDYKLVAVQSPLIAFLIKLMLRRRQADALVAQIANPLSRMLRPKLCQIAQESTQGILF